ncbi:MAG: hypothetical protein LH702_14260 [Phormidesmis sp. CAN_BIN44]|nr:hypothetical protein [Phormidesmis sp. CAN_BIN44]
MSIGVSRLSPNWVRLDWGEVSAKAIALLLPQVQWLKLLRQIQKHRKLAHDFRFEIRVKPIKPIPLPC